MPLKAMLRGKGPLSAAVVGGELLLSVTIRPDGAYRAVGSLGKRPRLLPSPLMRCAQRSSGGALCLPAGLAARLAGVGQLFSCCGHAEPSCKMPHSSPRPLPATSSP